MVLLLAISVAVMIVFAVSALFVMFFNRDPDRQIPAGRTVVSPADGKVMAIIDLEGLGKDGMRIRKGLIGGITTLVNDVPDARYLISIFMNPLNVHVQRSPVAGEVVFAHHRTGSFKVANSLDAMVDNEKNEILLDSPGLGRVKVIQISGIITKRIDCYVRAGQQVRKGDRLGRIRLGSQVVLIAPRIKLAISEGDKVYAGQTIIAQY